MIPLLLTLALAQETAPAPPSPAADPSAAPAPEADPEAETDPEAEAEPGSDDEPEPTADDEPAPDEEPEPTADDEPDPTADDEPAPDVGTAPPPVADPGEPEVARWSINAEYGTARYADDSFDIFSVRDGMDVAGLRVGRRLQDRLELQVGWLRGQRGAQVEVPDAAGGRNLAFQSAYDAHRFSAGLRADLSVDEVLFGYAAARGQLVVQRIRFDGDPNSRSNPDQVSSTALAPGGELVGGIELRVPQDDRPLTVAWTLEMGAEIVANATFADFGDLRSGGFVVHTGLGVRF